MPSAEAPQIPGFDHVRPLGAGRFAEVHLFEQRFPRRLVAVKVLRQQLGWDAEHAFELEANALAALSAHPCIVPIHDAGRSPDGLSYLVMEYCPLPSLGQQIRAGALSVEDALRIGILIAGAVDTAHAHGILHRDIKPANILMTDYGAPQLADFGIASSAADRNVVSGFTPAWAPPELVEDSTRASVATDVYSLAATVYTMVAGHAPHERPDDDNSAATIMARATTTAPRLDTDSDSMADVLARALSTDPNERYGSARLFGAALQDVERELGLPTTQMVLVDPPRRGVAEKTPGMSAVATMWSEANAQTIRDTPSVRRGARRVLAASAVSSLVLVGGSAAAFMLVSGDPPWSNPKQSDTTTPSASGNSPTVPEAAPLDLDAEYVNVPCNDTWLVMLGGSVPAVEGMDKLRRRVEGVPDVKYLKNSASCSTFDEEAAAGDIYQAYIGPYDSFDGACDAREFLQLKVNPNPSTYLAWVRHVSEDEETKKEMCACEGRAADLPVLQVGQSPEDAVKNKPAIAELEYILWDLEYKREEPLSGEYDTALAEIVKTYQRDNDKFASGVVTYPTWIQLVADYCD